MFWNVPKKSRPARIAWWTPHTTWWFLFHERIWDSTFFHRFSGKVKCSKMFASDLWRLKPVWPYSTFSWQIMSWNLIANCLQTAVFRRSRLKMYLYRPIFGLLWPMATWLFLPRCLACWLSEGARICFFTSKIPLLSCYSWYLDGSEWTWMDMNGHDIWGGQEALSNGRPKLVRISMDSLEMSSE